MGELVLLDTDIYSFAAALQGVVEAVLVAPPPSPAPPLGQVPALSLLHLHFACRGGRGLGTESHMGGGGIGEG